MKRSIFCLICLFFATIISFQVQAQEPELNKDFGIGIQGATPEFGGISLRYTGFAPVYLQTVGRFTLGDERSDHVFGAGISYAIFEHDSRWNVSRLYFALQGGWHYEKEPELEPEIFESTMLGGGIAFGGEIIFSLGGIPLGLNAEVGQGLGRKRENSQSKNQAGVYIGAGIHAYF